MTKTREASIKGIVLTGIAFISIIILAFFLLGKEKIYTMRDVVSERLTKGISEEKEQVTPEEGVLEAINANRTRTVKIYIPLQETMTPVERESAFLAKGIIFSDDGMIVTTRGSFQEDVPYSIVIPGRQEIVTATPYKIGEQLVFFKIEGKMPLIAEIEKSVPLMDDLVVAIGGKDVDAMATGKVLKVEKIDKYTFITTTIPSKVIEIGAPLLDQNQKVIGLYTKRNTDGTTIFIAGKSIKKNIE